MIDFSRFHLVGGPVLGHELMCLDCDVDEPVRWPDPSGLLSLGEMVRVAEAHVAARHPEKQAADARVGLSLTSADPEPPTGTLVVDDCGLEWVNDGHRPCCWVRPDLVEQGIHDPETWTKIAGNYGPVTVQRWGQ